MNKLFIILLLTPALTSAHDVVLRVDGQTVNTKHIEIIITSEPAPPAPPAPEPPDVRPPGGVTIGALNWRQSGGQQRIGLGSNTLALKFTTTSNPAYSGQVNTTHTTTNPTTRTQWISTSPGGEPLRPRCIASGREGVTLRWTQRVDARDCGLATDTTYYFNVKNALPGALNKSTCGGSCPFFMIIYTNQQP